MPLCRRSRSLEEEERPAGTVESRIDDVVEDRAETVSKAYAGEIPVRSLQLPALEQDLFIRRGAPGQMELITHEAGATEQIDAEALEEARVEAVEQYDTPFAEIVDKVGALE